MAPDNVTENQIDYFCISRFCRRCIYDVGVKGSADIGSDHHVPVAKVRLKIVKV